MEDDLKEDEIIKCINKRFANLCLGDARAFHKAECNFLYKNDNGIQFDYYSADMTTRHGVSFNLEIRLPNEILISDIYYYLNRDLTKFMQYFLKYRQSTPIWHESEIDLMYLNLIINKINHK